VGSGVRVALIADNSTYLIVALLAIQWAGGTAVLLDPRSDKQWLSNSLIECEAAMLLVEAESTLEDVQVPSRCKTFATERALSTDTNLPVDLRGRHPAKGSEPFGWLVTSGTTGIPKVTCITQYRAVLSGYGMGQLCLGLVTKDVIYCVLPLTHATGLLTGLCSALFAGCTLVVRRHFTTAGFWSDVEKESTTCLLYVGEVARYLLAAPGVSNEQTHCVRVAFGNGMALDIWHRFQARFRIPKIVEFYGATELPLALVNLGSKPGAMGRIAIPHFSPWRIVRRDPKADDLLRRADGTCYPCGNQEPGELILLCNSSGLHKSRGFALSGIDKQHHNGRLVRGVTRTGDWGLRTGDIVVRDENGCVKFIDRTFDLFRQNGRNTATSYLARYLRNVEGVASVGVTHLAFPHYDGHFGLAVIVPTQVFTILGLERECNNLAEHSRPRFLRLTSQLLLNRGFKFDQATYRAEGLDPNCVKERSYVYSSGHFLPITTDIWHELLLGQFRF
jgi:fatty-acyl-CoA synthase